MAKAKTAPAKSTKSGLAAARPRPSGKASDPLAPPVRTVVLATDFSPAAMGAAQAARFIRDALKAKVVALTVFERAGGDHTPTRQAAAAWRERVVTDAKAYLESHGLGGAAVVASEGEAAHETLKAIKKHKADLVIVGRRGSHGDRQRSLGTTARRLIRKSPVSVFVATREFDGEVEAIGASTDFSAGADAAVRRAAWLGRTLGLKAVDVLHAVEEAAGAFAMYSKEEFVEQRRQAAMERVEEVGASIRADGGPSLRLLVGEGRTADALAAMARKRRLDLLCLGAHGAGGTALLLGSTAERLLESTPCSVWLEKSPEDQRTLIERFARLIG